MAFSKRDAPNCDICSFSENCFFHYIDRPSQKEWKHLRIAGRFKSGDILFYEGQKPSGLYVVCRGRMKICKTNRSGQQLITRVKRPGDLVGHIPLFVEGSYESNGECMGETVVSLIDYAAFVEFLQNHPVACRALIGALARDIRIIESKANDIAYKTAKSRVADVLIQSISARSMKAGHPAVYGTKRRELAEMAGLSVETTVRTLTRLEEKKLIRRNDGHIAILDTETLRSIASSSF